MTIKESAERSKMLARRSRLDALIDQIESNELLLHNVDLEDFIDEGIIENKRVSRLKKPLEKSKK